jgi:hypothetical protein
LTEIFPSFRDMPLVDVAGGMVSSTPYAEAP